MDLFWAPHLAAKSVAKQQASSWHQIKLLPSYEAGALLLKPILLRTTQPFNQSKAEIGLNKLNQSFRIQMTVYCALSFHSPLSYFD